MAGGKRPNPSNKSASGNKKAKSSKGAPNTRRHIYIDTASANSVCKDDIAAIEKHCAPENINEKERRLKKSPTLLGKLKLPTHGGANTNPNAQWINDHCEFLMIKPSSPDEMFDELKNIPSNMESQLELKALEAAEAKIREKLEQAVKKQLIKIGLKQAVARVGSFFAGPWVGIAVNIAMSADGISDIEKAMKEFPELKREAEDALKKVKDAKEQIQNIKNQLDRYKEADGS